MAATPADNQDLRGNAPDRCRVALLIVDMMNALDFLGNEELALESVPLGRSVAALKREFRPSTSMTTGKWRSDFAAVGATL